MIIVIYKFLGECCSEYKQRWWSGSVIYAARNSWQ